jgi:hypothetical protein
MQIIILINIDDNLDDKNVSLLIKIWKKYMNTHINIKAYFIKISTNNDFDTIDIINNVLLIKSDNNIRILEKIIKSAKCLINNNINFNYIIKTNISSFFILNKLYQFLNNTSIDYASENIKGIPVKSKYKKYFEYIDKKNRLYATGSTIILSNAAIVDLINEHIDLNFDLNIDDEILIGLCLSKKYKLYKIPISDEKDNFDEKNIVYDLTANTNLYDIITYSTNLLIKFYNNDELNNDIHYKIKKICDEQNYKNTVKQYNHSDYTIELKLIDNSNNCQYILSKIPIVYKNNTNYEDFSCINDIIEINDLYDIKNDQYLFKKIFDEIKQYNKINNIDFTNEMKNEYLKFMNDSITKFVNSYCVYKKILFICNKNDTSNTIICEGLKKVFDTTYCDISILYFNNDNSLEEQVSKIHFKPNLIIKFNEINVDLKDIFNCYIIFIISTHDINNDTISQITKSDICFSNNLNIKNILAEKYSIETELFYSSYSLFYGITSKKYTNDYDKIYDFGFIIDDFNNKNLKEIIEYLKTKKNVILIGNNCDIYSNNNFKLVNTYDLVQIEQYTNNIKYILKNDNDDINIFDIQSYINGSNIKL